MRRAVFMSLALFVACKPKLEARVEQNDEGAIVVHATTDAGATVRVRDEECDLASCELRFAALDFPLGKNTLAVVATKKGKTRSIDVTFERKKVEPTLAISTKESGYVPCKSIFCAKEAKLKIGADSTMELRVVGPPSAKATIGHATVTLPAPSRYADASTATAKIDLHEWKSVVPLEGIDGSTELTVPIHVVVETDAKREDDLPIPVGWFRAVIHEAIAPIEKGPLVFDGDVPAPTLPKSMIIVGKSEDDVVFYGARAKLATLDLVAVRRDLPERQLLRCGPYAGATGSTVVKIMAVDQEIALYDRRTAKAKAKHRFFATYKGCPDSVSALGTGDETQIDRTLVDEKSIASWAKSVVGG